MAKNKTSKKVGKKSGGPKKNRFFEGLMEGLKQAAAHATGEITLPVRYYDVTPPVDVKAIRTKLKLSQTEFAARFRLNFRTVQDWESSGTQPPSAVRAYLIVIENDPEAVIRALAGRAA
jgi:putative transcriptional regulator